MKYLFLETTNKRSVEVVFVNQKRKEQLGRVAPAKSRKVGVWIAALRSQRRGGWNMDCRASLESDGVKKGRDCNSLPIQSSTSYCAAVSVEGSIIVYAVSIFAESFGCSLFPITTAKFFWSATDIGTVIGSPKLALRAISLSAEL